MCPSSVMCSYELFVAMQLHVDEFLIDSPKKHDPRLSDMEAGGQYSAKLER